MLLDCFTITYQISARSCTLNRWTKIHHHVLSSLGTSFGSGEICSRRKKKQRTSHTEQSHNTRFHQSANTVSPIFEEFVVSHIHLKPITIVLTFSIRTNEQTNKWANRTELKMFAPIKCQCFLLEVMKLTNNRTTNKLLFEQIITVVMLRICVVRAKIQTFQLRLTHDLRFMWCRCRSNVRRANDKHDDVCLSMR